MTAYNFATNGNMTNVEGETWQERNKNRKNINCTYLLRDKQDKLQIR